MKRLLTLLKVEGKVALRGIDGIFFGVIMPVAIALLIGFIAGDKPAYAGATHNYIEESFGTLITVGICATAFMGIPLGLADYRDKKILKRYFVTPVSPMMILITQVVINLLTALISSVMVYVTMKLVFGYEMRGDIGGFLLVYSLVIIAMYGLGMMMASLCKGIKEANLVCTIVYFPMIFLSGATIPFEILPNAVQKIANFLPLTQGVKLLKGYSLGVDVGSLVMPIVVLVGVAIIGVGVSVKYFKWE
ncbi:MAG: ABC transporter permease [Cellulosilyticaceae bacterium]